MKPAKVILATVLGIVAVILAVKLLSGLFGFLVSLITGLVGLAIGVAVIGGLGWVVLRLLGKKSITSGKHRSLP